MEEELSDLVKSRNNHYEEGYNENKKEDFVGFTEFLIGGSFSAVLFSPISNSRKGQGVGR
ncbi:MAG: hypothetical protein A2162_08770 [Deltaproteobacteria bacterium RBG_13_52_11b]|nr:MAG: hypothetical protein A2162_08770 [Deltaproteobacteria bacterium RBG_13_52_11b]